MNLEVKDIPAKIGPLISSLKRYTVIIFVLLMFSVYGFLVFRINSLTTAEPSDEAVQEKLTSVKRPKIDEEALKKINQLEEQNVEVQSLFKQARDNPFSE